MGRLEDDMSPKLAEEYSDFRKKQILEAAWECFIEMGYSKTTMREISKRLNASTGVLYNYFNGKDELFDAIQEFSIEQNKQIFNRMDKKETARGAIMEFFISHLECCPIEEIKKSARSNIGLCAEALKSENIRYMFSSYITNMQENISRFIREGIERRELNMRIDPEALAGFFIALLAGLRVQLALVDGLDTSAYIENIKKIVSENLWCDIEDNRD
jgi:AcrR family transcriptional regulator